MRQHILNGWLVAALVALVCLLGVTAYAEVKDDLPRTACLQGDKGVGVPAAACAICSPAPCGNMAPRA
ncbi:hypothetical protein [Mesorhizobium sp. B2-4-17]|uniref:hypothetical protein n=1 Tax=Mesorhizobium sp. B2-4-17 TaxID=2589932 RepID=UPI001128793E|nr:hypothetical protein [Mesorhizobium sp. B2-4-17]TPK91349.1 hypothetical protein FJ548_03640 [Mesorhizobium sp. B2-4-17]